MLDITDKSLMGEVVLYNPSEEIRLDVKLVEETVWLTQPQMVLLFESSKANISEHLKNIYSQGELAREATVRKFRTVRQEGERTDDAYLLGSSLKDMGSSMSAITKMQMSPEFILKCIK